MKSYENATGNIAAETVANTAATVKGPRRSRLGYPPMPPTPRSFAATRAETVAAEPAVTSTTAPLPKRPKGRFFIATLLLVFFGSCASYFYDGYIRYAAYGEVVGRKIELAPPWNGVVRSLHFRQGDYVRAGEPVFVIESLEMRHRMEMIEDSLNLERAQLASELARLKWEAERVEDTQQLVKADYYEKWSELLWEQSVLTDLKQKLVRAEKLNRADAFTVETLTSLQHQVSGKELVVDQLSEAVRSLKLRIATDRPVDPVLKDQIKPSLVRIENLQADLRRVRQLLDQGLVACPANGRVTRVWKYAGEYVDGTSPVLELVVDGSEEIVLYVPQASSGDWSIGDRINVCVEPVNKDLVCEVLRLAPEMQKAPESIMRHYNAGDVLLPVVVRPTDANLASKLILGSKVRLPRGNAGPRTTPIATWLRDSGGVARTGAERVSQDKRTTLTSSALNPESRRTSAKR